MKVIACLLAALLFSAPAVAAGPRAPIKMLDQHAGVRVSPSTATFIIFDEITRATMYGFNIFMREAQKNDSELNIYISSPGGDADVGMAIFDRLQAYPHKVTCTVGPMAASAAFLILQACDHRVADPRSRLMTHQVYVVLEGGPIGVPLVAEQLTEIALSLMKEAMSLRALSNELNSRIANRMGMPIAEYMKKVAGNDSWDMSAAEALAAHAIDEIRPDGT